MKLDEMKQLPMSEASRKMLDETTPRDWGIGLICAVMRAAGAETKMGLSDENVRALAEKIWDVQNPGGG